MFDKTNPYTLRTEVTHGITHYYISFKDGQAIERETEVSRPIYLEFLRFKKIARNLRRSDERHIERFELTEDEIHRRAINPQICVEDTVFDSVRNEQLRLAIQDLSEIQRRRFILYHEFEFTYEQIAEMEGCTFQAAEKAIKAAKRKITKIFETQG